MQQRNAQAREVHLLRQDGLQGLREVLEELKKRGQARDLQDLLGRNEEKAEVQDILKSEAKFFADSY